MRFPLPDGGEPVTVNVAGAAALLVAIADRLDAGRGFVLATLNLDHLVKLRASAPFRDAYRAADLVTADGNPVVWLSRLARQPVQLAPGSELVGPLAALAAARGAPVALFGSTEATLSGAQAALEAAYPGLKVVLRIAPPFGFDPAGSKADAYAARLAASGARLCFVALGAPKQEIFAARARSAAPACGFACVGAGLDFLAGAQRRAPRWARAAKLEWAWRMASDPQRLAGRYLRCALLLPLLVRDALRARVTD